MCKKTKKLLMLLTSVFSLCLLVSMSAYASDKCSHTFKDEIDYLDETCTTDGYYEWECESCGDIGYVVFPALGHNYKDQWVEILPATCYDRGVLTNSCSRCHEDIYQVIDRIAHTDADIDGICDVCSFVISDNVSPDDAVNPDDTILPEEPDIDVSDNQEDDKVEDNIFSFLTELLNNLFDLLKNLFKIS